MKEIYHTLDERRLVTVPGNSEETINFSAEHWIEIAEQSIKDHDFFAVALSGGSTPKKIYQKLTTTENAKKVDWSKVYLFWSDERSVPPAHPDSNYFMAMKEAGLEKLPIPLNQIFRMVAEDNIEVNAQNYEKIILEKLNGNSFDLVMLGMGDDGHTASLFPHTAALKAKRRLVVANFVPQKKAWRMTFTYDCINASRHICIYVMGSNKAEILQRVLLGKPDLEKYPSQFVGTVQHPALWVLDNEAAINILPALK